MNQVYIGEPTNFAQWPNAFCVAFEQADQYLQILRSDFFTKVTVSLPLNIQDKQLRFTMHLSRILKQKGQIRLQNAPQTNQAKQFATLVTKLGFYEHKDSQNGVFYSKSKPQQTKQQKTAQEKKITIGFKALETQQIDEDQLMKNENIDIQKSKIQNCAQKPRACANCNCGRKNNQQPVIPKQQLIESINEGKPVSGCGKCFLGDSFRCGTCPYKGLPAFKPGDKLKLMEEGQVVVQNNEVKVQGGKVKIQL